MEEISDVLAQGNERDPWRPSRRVVGVLVSAMLLGAGGLGVYTWQEGQAKEASRRQAVAGITLSSQMDPGTEISFLAWRLGVLNTSAIDVNVERASLDFPMLTLRAPEPRLRPYYRTALALPTTGVCDVGLYQRGPRSVLVQGRTNDGHDVTRQMALTPDEREELWNSLRWGCRFFRPSESLQSTLTDARLTGRTLTLIYEVMGAGVSPLVIDRISWLSGVDVDVDGLPMTLPSTKAGPRRLVVRLHVASCRRLVASLRRGMVAAGGDRPGTSLTVDVHHKYEQGPGELPFYGSTKGVPQRIDHGLRPLRTCPGAADILEGDAFGH